MASPLQGIKVLEVAGLAPGPYCGLILAGALTAMSQQIRALIHFCFQTLVLMLCELIALIQVMDTIGIPALLPVNALITDGPLRHALDCFMFCSFASVATARVSACAVVVSICLTRFQCCSC